MHVHSSMVGFAVGARSPQQVQLCCLCRPAGGPRACTQQQDTVCSRACCLHGPRLPPACVQAAEWSLQQAQLARPRGPPGGRLSSLCHASVTRATSTSASDPILAGSCCASSTLQQMGGWGLQGPQRPHQASRLLGMACWVLHARQSGAVLQAGGARRCSALPQPAMAPNHHPFFVAEPK